MRILNSLLMLPLLSGPALAAGGSWDLLAESGGCTVTLVAEMVDDGIFFVDRGTADCGPDLARVTGYALNDEGNEFVLYSTLEGVDLLGQLTREGEGIYRGKLRNGMAVRMEHSSGPRGISDPRTGLTTGEDPAPAIDTDEETTPPTAEFSDESAPQATEGCPTYSGSRTCADPLDQGPPTGGMLQTLTRMNLRNINGTTGSEVVGQAPAGTCFDVSLCDTDAEGRLWCSVSTAELTGWVLKQDADTVYSRNSCL